MFLVKTKLEMIIVAIIVEEARPQQTVARIDQKLFCKK